MNLTLPFTLLLFLTLSLAAQTLESVPPSRDEPNPLRPSLFAPAASVVTAEPLVSLSAPDLIDLGQELRVPGSSHVAPLTPGPQAEQEAQWLNERLSRRRLQARAGEHLSPQEAEQQAQEVEDYIVANPDSPYVPALRVEMGKYYRVSGRISRALFHWRTAWEETQAYSEGEGKRIGGESLALLGTLLASLGRLEELQPLIQAENRRIFSEPHLAQLWRRTKEAYSTMVRRPGISYRCGPIAMFNVVRALGGQGYGPFLEAASPLGGFSLAELVALGDAHQAGLQAAYRPEGARLVVPSVVHWKENHYAAIVAEEEGRYLIQDPTFGQELWVTFEALDSEASGYFLIPFGPLLPGWRAVSAGEAAQVYGRGYPNTQCDSCPEPCQECCEEGDGGSGTGSGTNECGMVTWKVSEPTINLVLKDTPYRYRAAYGPDFVVAMEWRQRGKFVPFKDHSYFDGSWGCDLLSYIDGSYGKNHPTAAALFYLYRGDGTTVEIRFDSGSATSQTDLATGIWAKRTTSGGGTETSRLDLYFRNGSTERYDAVGSASYDYKIITRTDATGKSLTFSLYDSAGGSTGDTRLREVTTADGSVFEFLYPGSTEFRITKIRGPGGFECIFGYTHFDTDGNGTGDLYKLTSIQDMTALTSSFQYDPETWWIQQITTPYGTTAFDHYDAGACGGYTLGCPGIDRYTIVTEPTGDQQVFVFYDNPVHHTGTNEMSGKIPAAFSATQLPVYGGTNDPPLQTLDTVRHTRNTHYWNRQQAADLSNPDPHSFNAADYRKSRTRHWSLVPTGTFSHLGPLNWELPPSLDGTTERQPIFYDYAGKDPYLTNWFTGTNSLPTVQAQRLLPTTTNYTHYLYFERNLRRMLTKKIERWKDHLGVQFRTNTYTYATGTSNPTIDHLLRIREIDPQGKLVYGYKLHPTYPDQIQYKTNGVEEVTQYDYDSHRRITAITNHAGMKSAYTYHGSSGRLQRVVDSIGGVALRTNSYTWTHDRLLTHTDPSGLLRTFSHDSLGRLLSITYPDSTTDQYLYSLPAGTGFNSSGSALPLLDPIGFKDRENRYWYTIPNRLRQIVTLVEPPKATGLAGVQTTLAYCGCGSPTTIVRASNTGGPETTTISYNYGGLPLITTFPDGAKLTNGYDTLGRRVTSLDQYRKQTNYYDGLSRLFEIRDGGGTNLGRAYDTLDRVVTETNRHGVKLTLAFDAVGRLTQRSQPDGGVERWGYTKGFQEPTAYTNQVSNVTLWKFDAAQRQTNEIVVGVYTNVFTYNGADDLVGLKDGKGQNTTWSHDVYGRVYRKFDHLGTNVLQYLYSSTGRLTNRWSKQKGATAYQYDAVGNLTNVVYPTSPTLQFVYDAFNRLAKDVNVGVITNVYTYKPGGQLESENTPQWASSKVTLGYTSRLRTSLALQQPSLGNWTHAYTYDTARRLSSLSGSSGTFNYAYTPAVAGAYASRLVQGISIPTSPGSVITNQYDTTGRLRGTTLRGASTTFNSHAFTGVNQAHQLTRQRRPDSTLVDYTYDAASQLKTALSSDSSGLIPITTEQFQYGYDTAQNMVKFTNTAVTTYTVNPLNQVTGDGTFTYTYDWNGNRVTKSGGTVFAYDDENQLTTITYQPGSGTGYRTTLTYDARGRMRVRKEESWTSGGGYVTLSTTRYLYDGMRVLQERNASNVPQVTYTMGLDLSGTWEGAGGIGGKLARTAHSGGSGGTYTHAFYHADRGGNVTYLLQANQTLGASYYYDPYGRELSSSGPLAAANTLRFSSKERLNASGLYYYCYRFYDPVTQRWLNRDPIGEAGGINLYGFVGNNPVNSIDPFGLLTFGESMQICGAFFQGAGQGLTAEIDGALPFFDPFASAGAYDPNNSAFKASQTCGAIASCAVGGAGGLRGAAIFGRSKAGRFLNHNRYVRIGPGNIPKGKPFTCGPGQNVPTLRIGKGPPRPWNHFDLRAWGY